jgi:hypothetical protein
MQLPSSAALQSLSAGVAHVASAASIVTRGLEAGATENKGRRDLAALEWYAGLGALVATGVVAAALRGIAARFFPARF